jgi:hypothetical protein
MRDGADYIAGVRRAYVGELAASRLYRVLAGRRTDTGESAKLAAIAHVESRTAEVLEPVARRLGITCDGCEIDDIVQRRVVEMSAISWSQFIEQALEAWPPYVEQFAALREQAPATDARALEWLLAHERALIEFLHIERLEPRTRASLAPLEAYLASTG